MKPTASVFNHILFLLYLPSALFMQRSHLLSKTVVLGHDWHDHARLLMQFMKNLGFGVYAKLRSLVVWLHIASAITFPLPRRQKQNIAR